MGELYRGLTIRIGADTSGLESALQATNGVVSKTQYLLRNVNEALKMDPRSINAITTNLSVAKEQLSASVTRMRTLRETAEGIDVRYRDFDELAAATERAATKAANADAVYSKLISRIAETKAAIAKRVNDPNMSMSKATKAKPEDFNEWLGGLGKVSKKTKELIEEYKKLVESFKSAAADKDAFTTELYGLQKLGSEMLQTGATTKKLSQEIVDLKRKTSNLFNNAEFTKARNGLDRIAESERVLKERSDSLTKAMRLNPGNIDMAREKIVLLAQREQLAAEKAELLKRQLGLIDGNGIPNDKLLNSAENLRKCAEESGKWERALQEARGELNRLENEKRLATDPTRERALTSQIKEIERKIRSLESAAAAADERLDEAFRIEAAANLKSEIATAEAGIKAFEGETAGFVNKNKMATSSLLQLGMSSYATLTPIANSLKNAIISSADEIDASYRNMRKTVEGTEEQFEGLRRAALDYSKTHITSAQDILEIQAMGGQLGLATSSLEAFSVTCSNLDIATDLDVETISKDLGQLRNILQMSDADFGRFGDSLVRLGNNNAALESSIMNVTMRMGSMASLVGMSADQILAWSTAIASTGMGPEAAGTAISKTMSQLEGAVAKGGSKLADFAKVSGMSSKEFAKAWKDDASSAMQAFVLGLRAIDEKGGSVDKTLQDLGITGVRQKQALEGLTQATGVLNDSLTMSKNAWHGVADEWGQAGDAAREAEKKSEGFSGALAILQNNTSLVGEELGETLTPVLQALGTIMAGVNDVLGSMPDSVKRVIAVTGMATATIGPAMTGLAAVKGALKSYFSEERMNANVLRKASKEAERKAKATAGTAAATEADSAANAANTRSNVENTAAVKANARARSEAASKTSSSSAVSKAAKDMDGAAKAADAAEDAISDMGGSMDDAGRKSGFLSSKMNGLSKETQLALKAVGALGAGFAAGIALDVIIGGIASMAEYVGMLDKVKKHSASAADATKAYADSYGRVREAHDGFDASNVISGYDDMKSALQGVIDSTDSMIASVSELNSAAGEKNANITKYMGDISDFVGKRKLSSENLARLRQGVADLNEQLGSDYAVKKLKGVWSIVDDKGKAVSDSILKRSKELRKDNLFKAASEGADTAMANMKNAEARFEEMYEYVNGKKVFKDSATEEMVDEVMREMDTSSRVFVQQQGLANAILQASDSKVAKKVVEDQDALNALVANLADTNYTASDFVSTLRNAGIAASDLDSAQLNALADEFDGTFGSIEGLLSEFGIQVSEADTATARAADGIKECLGSMGDDFNGTAAKLVEGGYSVDNFTTKLAEYGITSKEVSSMSADDLDRMVDAYVSSKGRMGDALQGLVDESKDKGMSFGSEFWNAVSKSSAGAKLELPKGLLESEKVRSTAQTNGTDIGTLYSKSAADYIAKDGEKGLVAALKKAASNGVSDSRQTYEDSGKQLGGYIGRGIASGIDDPITANRVKQATKNLAKAANATVRMEFMIASPSKLWRKYGRYLGEGAALGISDSTAAVVRQAESMAASVNDAAAMGLSTAPRSIPIGYNPAEYGAAARSVVSTVNKSVMSVSFGDINVSGGNANEIASDIAFELRRALRTGAR